MKLLSFQITASAAAIIFAYLGVILLLAPDIHIDMLGLVPDDGARIMGRRSAPAFLALAIIFWMFRQTYANEVRRKVALGGSAMLFLIAIIGLADFFAGRAGPSIFTSIVVEALFGLAFLPYIGRTKTQHIQDEPSEDQK